MRCRVALPERNNAFEATVGWRGRFTRIMPSQWHSGERQRYRRRGLTTLNNRSSAVRRTRCTELRHSGQLNSCASI